MKYFFLVFDLNYSFGEVEKERNPDFVLYYIRTNKLCPKKTKEAKPTM